MKTNLVKKGSEKNIEMFQMSNEELIVISGGRYDMILDENGVPTVLWRPGLQSSNMSFFNRF